MSFISPPTFQRPAGEPGELMAAATVMGWLAEAVGDCATQVAFSVASIPGWTGPAFQAAVQDSIDAGMTVREIANALTDFAHITRTLAEQLADAQADTASAQQRAWEVANWAMSLTNPVYGLFNSVIGFADSAGRRADDAKRNAANAYAELIARAPHYVAPPVPRHAAPERGIFSSIGHGLLDVVGLVPVIGEPADLANAAWYTAEGDLLNAALSSASAVPLVGWAAQGAKWTRRTVDVARGIGIGDDVTDAARIVDGIRAPSLEPSVPRLGGSDAVPPIEAIPSTPRDLPGRQQQPSTAGHIEPDPPKTPSNRDVPTSMGAPVVPARPTLEEAIRENARRSAAAAAHRSPRTPSAPNGRDLNAADLNAAAAARGHAPPYSQVWRVETYTTTTSEQFVRFSFGDGGTGRWLVRASDVADLRTPEEIIDRLALPVPIGTDPRSLVVQHVTVPPGVELRSSVVRAHQRVETGGHVLEGSGHLIHGNQYEILDPSLDHIAFSPARPVAEVAR